MVQAIFVSVGCQEIEYMIFFVALAWGEFRLESLTDISFMVSAFQTLIEPSYEQDARMSFLTGEKATSKIVSEWPASVYHSMLLLLTLKIITAPDF